MGEVVPTRTSPTLHPPSPPTVHQLSRLALLRVNEDFSPVRIKAIVARKVKTISSDQWGEILMKQYTLMTNHARLLFFQQIRMKNRQLKEIIDQSRTIVWEINTMMTMRKS